MIVGGQIVKVQKRSFETRRKNHLQYGFFGTFLLQNVRMVCLSNVEKFDDEMNKIVVVLLLLAKEKIGKTMVLIIL